MKKVILSIVALIATTVMANAEIEFTEYEWQEHGLSFKLPKDLNVVKSSETEFELDNENFNFLLEIGDYEEGSGEQMGEELVHYSAKKGVNIGEATVDSFSGEGFQAVYVEGDREDDKACVALLLSENSHLLVLVTILYGHGFEDEINEVLNSFEFSK